ncbi:MAG: LPS export ABC transporter permease LptF [Alphaproteobacteria bacterium]|nr:LPS export ABC transporter permease LptF [Alphaproteobacteria bacterium]
MPVRKRHFVHRIVRYNAPVSSLTRYILSQLLGPLGFVTLTLTGVVWLMQSLRFLDLIINKGQSLGSFLAFTLVLLPGFLGFLLPIATFCAVVFVYLRLESDSEIIVMRAAGVSEWRLVVPALLLGLGLAAILYSLTLYLAPLGYRSFKDMQFVVRNNVAAVLLQEGAFTQVINGVTTFVRERLPNGELRGLLVHDERDKDRPVTVMAESGLLVTTADGPRFVVRNGNRQEIDRDRNQLSLLYFDEYGLDIGAFAVAPETRWREGSERFLGKLFHPGPGPDDVKNADRFYAEAHRRLLVPFHPLALIAIALAALLSSDFSRRDRWGRILVGGLAAVLFELVGLGLMPIVGRSIELVPLLYVHVFGTIAAAAYVTLRRKRPLGRRRAASGAAP